MKERVVITGMGAVSPAGLGIKCLWKACLQQKTLYQDIFPHWKNNFHFHSQHLSVIPPINYENKLLISSTERIFFSPLQLDILIALEEALLQAKYKLSLINKRRKNYTLDLVSSERSGVIIGVGAASVRSVIDTSYNENTRIILEDSLDHKKAGKIYLDKKYTIDKFNPLTFPLSACNSLPVIIAMKLSLNGSCYAVGSSCCSSSTAMGQAIEKIHSGAYDMIVTGGGERLDDRIGLSFKSFDVLGASAIPSKIYPPQSMIRPFDKDHSGTLFSCGGSAIFILESLSHAKHRQAPILAEIVGYHENCDGYHILKPKEDGKYVQKMLETLLDKSSLKSKHIDYINAHGTGTKLNDQVEAKVLQAVFNERPFINSSKAILGHSMGASSGLESIITVCSLINQQLHGMHNLSNPIRPLNFTKGNIHTPLNYAINQSLGFGGHNTGIVFKRFIKA